MITKKQTKKLIVILLLVAIAYLLYTSGFIKGFLDGFNSVN